MKNSQPKRGVLDRETRDLLLAGLAAIEPPAGRAEAMRARILGRAAAERSPGFVTVRESEGDWIEIAPKVKSKDLFNDGQRRVYLVKMEPGASMPGHDHEGNEECMVLDGSVWLGDIYIRAGDFHLAPTELAHGPVRSDEGVLLYVSTGVP